MSNLESAKIAIEAELAHARQGLAHYHSRIDALDKTLAQLADIDGGSGAAVEPVAPPIKRGERPQKRWRKSQRRNRRMRGRPTAAINCRSPAATIGSI